MAETMIMAWPGWSGNPWGQDSAGTADPDGAGEAADLILAPPCRPFIGQAQGLIQDVPTVQELFDRILQEARQAHQRTGECLQE